MREVATVSIEGVAARLRSTGSVFAEEEAALLAAEATSPEKLIELVAKRMSGLPLEQVVGWAEFCGLRIVVDPGVFVPRQRTRFLVELATGLAAEGDIVLDLCCGTGAIGAAIAAAVPGIEIYASDVDPAAVRCARRNLPTDRVFEGDLFDAVPHSLAGRINILVANAPYVPTDAIRLMPPEARLFEASVALDGGADGLGVHRRIIQTAPTWMVPGGSVLIEASESQASSVVELFTRAGLAASVRHSDELETTVVVGVLPTV